MKEVVKGPNAVTAIQDAALSDIFTVDNCAVVYAANGNYKSWVPGRSINSFNSIEVGKGYIPIMISTDPVDVSAHFSDGLPAGAGGFAYGFLVSNTSSKDIDFDFFNGSNVDMNAGGTITAGSFRFFASADFITGAASAKFIGDVTDLQYIPITLVNDAFTASSDGSFSDVTAFAGVIKSNVVAAENSEALNIIAISDTIVPTPPEYNFYFSNLTADSLDIVKSSDHAQIVHTVASGETYIAPHSAFGAEDYWSIIPAGANYKAVAQETHFNGTTSALKYQVPPEGIQQIPKYVSGYGNHFMVFLPDASDAGTWT